MRKLNWTAVSLACLALGASAWAEDPDTLAIVKKVDETTKQVKMISYKAKVYGTDAFAAQIPVIEGMCIAKLDGERGSTPHIYFEAKTGPDATTKLHDQMAFDGKNAVRIDHLGKRVTTGTGPALIQAGMNMLYMQEFFHPTPFTDEINAERKYEGKQKVGDAECHVIFVTYAGGAGEARWFFGVEDSLPHRVDRLFEQDGQKGSRVLELYDVSLTPEITETTFKPAAPADYEKREAQAGTPAAPRGPLAAGAPAPDFELSTPASEAVKLADQKDHVVVLTFWNTFTRNSVEALKATDKLAAEMEGKPVKFFAVNAFDDETADIQGYVTKHELKTPVLLKGDATARGYLVRTCPYFYVIGKDGKVIAAGQGADAADKTAEAVKKALE